MKPGDPSYAIGFFDTDSPDGCFATESAKWNYYYKSLIEKTIAGWNGITCPCNCFACKSDHGGKSDRGTTQELLSALQTATEEITGEPLSLDEKNELFRLFNQGSGAGFERAMNTISRFTELSREEITNKTTESESTDQATMVLEHTIRNWRPKA